MILGAEGNTRREGTSTTNDYPTFIGTADNGPRVAGDAPEPLIAASILGFLYFSEDGGDTWTKRRKEFGHVRTFPVTPRWRMLQGTSTLRLHRYQDA